MQYKFPFRVGITGHRNLTDKEKHRVIGEIKKALKWIRIQVQQARGREDINADYFISGITPLAEGADRIFADEILSDGGKLEVILPFKTEIYKQDFETHESKSEFDRLLNNDQYPLVIDPSNKPNKEKAYYYTGKLVVDQCDILIAVWNGGEAKGAGGTKNIIEYAKESNVPIILIYLDERMDTAYFDPRFIDMSEYRAFDTEWAQMSIQPAVHDQISGEFGPLRAKIGNHHSKTLSTLFDIFDSWDLEAILHQKSHKRMIVVLYSIAALASLLGILTLLFEKAIHIKKISLTFHFIEGFALISVLIWYAYIKYASKQKKWVQSRIWAEKTRLQIFESICTKRKSENTDENLRWIFYQNKSWHARFFLSVAKRIRNDISSNLPLEERIGILKNYLIEKQYNYHKNKLLANEKLTKKLHLANLFFWGVAISCICSEVIMDVLMSLGRNESLMEVHEIFGAIIVLIPVCGALIEGYKGMVDHQKAINTDKNMKLRLSDILKDLRLFCRNDDDLLLLFEKTETVMLYETNDWILLIKDPEPTL